MRSAYWILLRTAAILLLIISAHWVQATPAGAQGATAGPLRIEALGKGAVALNGPWQFHPGDDLAWASATFDSSEWEQLSADQPWGRQRHAHLSGFAWYRCSLMIDSAADPAVGAPQELSLLVPSIQDSYEIYWNGSLVGSNGRVPPEPSWYISQPAQSYDLGRAQKAELAVRVWKAPLLSDDSGELGGFDAAPWIGNPEAIANAKAANEFQWLRSRQLHFGANLLCGAIAFLSFLLWLRARSRWALFWMTGFAIAQPANLLLLNAHLRWSYTLAMGASQPLCAMQVSRSGFFCSGFCHSMRTAHFAASRASLPAFTLSARCWMEYWLA
jgi:hypothetical protein